MITFLRAHKHVISRVMITFSLIAFGALWLSWCGPFRCLFVYALLVMLFAAQLFWVRHVLDLLAVLRRLEEWPWVLDVRVGQVMDSLDLQSQSL